MIKGFRHKGLRLLFESGNKRGVPAKLADKITRRLDALHAAVHPLHMFIPGFDMHELQGGEGSRNAGCGKELVG